MKSSGIAPNNTTTELAKLPVKVMEELRRTVDSAYEDVARNMKRARHAATDALDDSRHQIKRHPITAVGSAALGGVALGFVIGWFASAARRK
ncbi:MAG TPA: hypothetical protein VG498_04225 [Terriglobales bacterium]|nr:hypothetical protein [Terriglobales bacterium]